MSIIIADAKPEDVEGATKVFRAAWLDTYPNEEFGVTREDIEYFYRDSLTPDTLEKRREQVRKLSANEKYFVAKDGDMIVGVCRLIKHADKNELKSVYILSEYRGQGIGSMFWNEALKFFDPKKDISVIVAVYNDKAVSFYKKLGFVDSGERISDEKWRMKSGAIIPDLEMIFKR